MKILILLIIGLAIYVGIKANNDDDAQMFI